MFQIHNYLLKTTATLFFAATLFAASAQTTDILNQFTAKIKSMPAFEMKFSMVDQGSDYEGIVQSQGEMFRFTSSVWEFFCDGTSKWIYNIENKELTILKFDRNQSEISENPLAFFETFEKNYSYNPKALSAIVNGLEVWRIGLKPLDKKLAYSSITLTIEKATLSPVTLEFIAKNEAKYLTRITSLVEKAPWPVSYFTFPTSRLTGLNVTDLR